MIKVLSKTDDEQYDIFSVMLDDSYLLQNALEEIKTMETSPFNYCMDEWKTLPKWIVNEDYYHHNNHGKHTTNHISEESDTISRIRYTYIYQNPLLRAIFDIATHNKDTDKWGNILTIADCIEELFPQTGYKPFIAAAYNDENYQNYRLVNSCIESFKTVNFDIIESKNEHITVKNPKLLKPGFNQINNKKYKVCGSGRLNIIENNTALLMLLTGKDYYYDINGKVKTFKLK